MKRNRSLIFAFILLMLEFPFNMMECICEITNGKGTQLELAVLYLWFSQAIWFVMIGIALLFNIRGNKENKILQIINYVLIVISIMAIIITNINI